MSAKEIQTNSVSRALRRAPRPKHARTLSSVSRRLSSPTLRASSSASLSTPLPVPVAGGEDDVLCTAADGIAAMEMTLACALSAREGRPLTPRDVPGHYTGV